MTREQLPAMVRFTIRYDLAPGVVRWRVYDEYAEVLPPPSEGPPNVCIGVVQECPESIVLKYQAQPGEDAPSQGFPTLGEALGYILDVYLTGLSAEESTESVGHS